MWKMAMAMDSEEWIGGGTEMVNGHVVLHGAEKLERGFVGMSGSGDPGMRAPSVRLD